MPTKPEILKVSQPDRSRLFKVERLDLRFSNGEERQFERLMNRGNGAVMVVALTANNEVVLIREYAAGLEDYVLTLPKGVIDPGENATEAANRELQEEAGFGAKRLTAIKQMSAAPNYMGHMLDLVIAQDLFESRLPGDEPEPLEVVTYPLSNIDQLVMEDEFHEGRAIAALYLARQWFEAQDH